MSAKIFAIRMVVALIAVLGFALHRWTGAAPLLWLGSVSYFICLAMYARSLFTALVQTRRVTADLLVVTVMVVSFLAKTPLSGALVAWFISLGLAISFFIIERTQRRIEALTRQKDKDVRVMRDGTFLEVPVEAVRPGDVAIVPQGEMIPVDGQIVEGASSVDESVITGEPFSVYRQAGDRVTSGSICLASQLKVRADKAGDKGFLYVMSRDIAASLKAKPGIHQRADKIVQFFICGVVLYAIGAFLFTGGLGARGILVRGGIPLEMVGRAVHFILDKTGTITRGKPRVTDVLSFGPPKMELLRLAASVESAFNHPVAGAVLAYAAANGVFPLTARETEYLPGIGVKAVAESREVILGSAESIAAQGMTLPADVSMDGRAVWIAVDGKTVGAVVIQDVLTDSAQGLADALRDLGAKSVVLATGDNDEVEARRVARRIGANRCQWGLKPEDKVCLVRELTRRGTTVMVGDGVNDALSLSQADVGISIGSNKADLAIKSSDIVIMREDASSLLAVVRSGRRLIRVIRQNYAWAIGFNLAGIALATAGVLSPWLAALFHHASSVLVVANSARLVKIPANGDL
ncbi:hypothetical protein DSCW_39200 [Desulfosarcina widdelii]|uniref:P-type ATPase A domain-containing protein n=1 Tax=Desulfosarcina widdelii TaxID=947919 RepID=A0A5K7Z9H8_9BACT|nr:HAD-IC family P-type ATPase [Desulfosarcina widdelii]BBO76503.1 hypothetical protein DSCW_39200 [Desulfosarcina widdelii]